MTLKLALSQIKALPFDFAEEVEKFRLAKIAHQSTEGEAAPSVPHTLVEHAVKRVPRDGASDDFVSDYEIIDDTPPPPSLDERKQVLVSALGTAANAAIAAIIPPLKRRLRDLEYHRITGLLSNAKLEKVENETPEERYARALATLSPDDLTHYLAHQASTRKIEAIVYQLAQGESAIHDLTEQTVGAWKAPAFAV
jgi:hypothetical protein